MACCQCAKQDSRAASTGLPLICMVPRTNAPPGSQAKGQPPPSPASSSDTSDGFQFMSDDYIKKHFKLGPRAMYLDSHIRPLITFPMTQELSKHFNLFRKTKINQQILDGYLHPSEAIQGPPSVFPYGDKIKKPSGKGGAGEEDEEIIYILQLPDLEYRCPIHNELVRTPRFIWHSCKKEKPAASATGVSKRGGGPMNKPKPWLLSRHTDFDLLSQW